MTHRSSGVSCLGLLNKWKNTYPVPTIKLALSVFVSLVPSASNRQSRSGDRGCLEASRYLFDALEFLLPFLLFLLFPLLSLQLVLVPVCLPSRGQSGDQCFYFSFLLVVPVCFLGVL
jgi:hypothetical protein